MKQDISKAIVKLGNMWVQLQGLMADLEEQGVPKEITDKLLLAMRAVDQASDELEPFQ